MSLRAHSLTLVFTWVAALACSLMPVDAQGPSRVPNTPTALATIGSRPRSEPVTFSKVYLPLARITEVSKEYIPVPQARFDELVASATAKAERPRDARVVAAQYSARFVGGELTDGTAQLDVTYEAEGRGALRLDRCTLPLSSPEWLGEASENTEALVGTDPRGGSLAIVDAPGTLAFRWSLRGQPEAAATYRFSARLPNSLDTVVTLLVPDAYDLSVTHGLVTVESDSPQTNRWTIRLGSRSQLNVVVSPSQSNASSGPVALYSESIDYRISVTTVDMRCRLDIDVLQTHFQELNATLPPEATVRLLQLDGKSIGFDVIRQNADSTPRIRTSALMEAGNHLVEIDFSFPCRPHVRFDLPRIIVPDMVWRRGSARVTADAPLRVTELAMTRVWQRDVTAAETVTERVTREFEWYDQDSRITLRVEPPAQSLQVRQGTTITLGGPSTTAVMVMGLSTQSGEVFQLEGRVHSDWIIDSVQMSQPELLEDWQVMPDKLGQRLEVRLRRPIRRSQSARMTLVAHQRQRYPNERIRHRDLRCLTLPDAQMLDDVMCIRSSPNQQLKVEGENVFFPIDELIQSARFATLISARRGDLVYRPDRLNAGLVFYYVEGVPEWTGDLLTLAEASRSSLSETYRVEITSSAAAVDKVVIRLHPSRAGPVRWSIAGAVTQPLAARRLESSNDSREEWEVQLPETKESVVPLIGQRSFVTSELATEVTRLSAPQAAAQRSVVEVQATPEATSLYEVESSASRLPDSGSDRQLGRFLIQARRSSTDRVLLRKRENGIPQAWVTKQTSEIQLSPTGEQIATYRWEIENRGLSAWEIELPAGLVVRDVQRNGESVKVLPATRHLTVPLPEEQRWVVINAEFAHSAASWNWMTVLELKDVPTSMPTLQTERHVVLPAQWRPVVGGDAESWPQRFFGILTRSDRSDRIEHRYALPISLTRLTVVHVPTTGWITWVGFWASALAVGLVGSRCQARGWIVGVVLLSAALIVLPWPWLGVARGLLAGWLFAGLVRQLLRRRVPQRGFASRYVTAGMSCVLVLLALPAGILGQSSIPAHFRVLIPAGEDEKQFGYVYVPTRMYELLMRETGLEASSVDRWVMQSIRYNVRLDPGLISSSREVPVDVSIRLHSFAAGQSIELPIPPQASFSGPTGLNNDGVTPSGSRLEVKLDGELIDWEWGPQRKSIQLQVAYGGEHLVQWTQRTIVEASGQTMRVATIPHPHSSLEITASRDDLDLVVSGQLGGNRSEEDGRRQLVELGATSEVRLSWTDPTSPPAASRLVLFGRFQIDPGAVLCDLMIRSADRQPLPPTLRVDLGRTLQPLATGTEGRWIRRPERDGNAYEVLTDSSATVRLRCLSIAATGIGELPLPQVQVAEGQFVQTVWAGDVNPALTFEQVINRDAMLLSTATLEEILAAPITTEPDFIVSPQGEEVRWRLRTFPRRSVSLAEMSTKVHYQNESTLVDFQAKISPLEGRQFVHRFQVPSDLEVREVSFTKQGALQPFHWSRQEEMLYLLVEEPVDGAHVVRIQAEQPNVSAGEVDVPLITIDDYAIASYELEIVREANRWVTIVDTEHLQIVPNKITNRYRSPFVVATLQSDAERTPSARVEVSDYRPVVTGNIRTQLQFQKGRWEGVADVELEMPEGAPDRLVFELDDKWGNLQVTASDDWSWEERSDRRRFLVCWPSGRREIQTQPTDLQIHLSGPLVTATSVVTPRLWLRDQPHVERFVSVPQTLAEGPLQWSTLGAMEAEIEDSNKTKNLVHYQLREADGSVRLRQRAPIIRPPWVLFSDSQWWLEKKSIVGDVRWSIHPRGSHHVSVHIPEGFEFVAALIDDRLTSAKMTEEGALSIRLGPSRLPQTLRILLHKNVGAAGRFIDLSIPSLSAAGQPTHLWSVISPKPLGRETRVSAETLSREEARTWRLEQHLTSLQAVDTVSTYSKADLTAWFSKRIQEIGERWGPAPLPSAAPTKLKNLADRWSAADAFSGQLTRSLPAETLPIKTQKKNDGVGQRTFLTSASQVRIRVALLPQGASLYRRLILAGMVALTGILVACTRSGLWFLRASFFAMPALLGCVWIGFLRLPGVGITLILVSLALAFLPPATVRSSAWHPWRVLLPSRPQA